MTLHASLNALGLCANDHRALEAFITEWMSHPNVLGAMLTGSYAHGLNDRFSDMDIYVVLFDDAPERQRGNHMIHGVVVEYNADPIRYIRSLQTEQQKVGLRHCARKIACGKILFEVRDVLTVLQREADALMRTPFTSGDTVATEMGKYYLWDQLEDLRRLVHSDLAGFAYAYYCGIQNILMHYGKYCGVEVLRPVRIPQFVRDADFREKYRVAGFEAEFAHLVDMCIRNVSFENVETLTTYVQRKMGGFILDGWTLRVAVPP